MNPQNYNNLGLCSKILLNVKKKEIDSEDFRDLKSDYSVIIEKLEAKLYTLGNELLGIEPLLEEGISRLLKLNYIGKLDEKEKDRICQDDLPEMRDLISTIYPQKLTCEKGVVRTVRLNEVVNCIYMINNELDKNKNWTSDLKINLSSKVAASVIFSHHFIHDLKKLTGH